MTRTAVKDALLAELSAHSLDCQEYIDSVRRRVIAGRADHVG